MSKITYLKAKNNLQLESLENELRNIHITNQHEIMSKIHKAALENPKINVKDLLKKENISYNKYQYLIKNHLSIPQVRKEYFGSSRELTQNQKDELVQRFNKNKFKGKGDTICYDNIDVNQLIENQFK